MRFGKLLPVALFALSALAATTAQAQYTYVGSWDLATIDGGYGNPLNPFVWTSNPLSYSGVDAAAMLFGGSASDYAISTVDANPADINHLAFVDGWGDDQYLFSPTSETFSLQTGTGYNDPGGYQTAYSAYVVDHSPFDGNGSFVNYAFRVNAQVTPEPGSVALLVGMGLSGAGFLARRRKARLAA